VLDRLDKKTYQTPGTGKMLQAARAITWSNRPVNATKKKDAASSEDLFPAAVEINQQYRFGVASL